MSSALAPCSKPRIAHADAFASDGAVVGARPVRGSAERADGHAGRPASTLIHARAHRPSMDTSGRAVTSPATLRASSGVRAPPLYASGGRKGVSVGGALHHTAHRKRRRRVGAIEQTAAKRSDTEAAEA